MLTVDPAKCTKCGLCVRICPCGVIGFGESGLPEMNARMAQHCIECGHCAIFCPEYANSLSFLKIDDMVKTIDIPMPCQAEAFNLLKTRRSIRCFEDRPIPKETLKDIMDTVKMAPSACNDQAVRWIVSYDPAKTKEITNIILCWMREEIFKDPTSPVSLLGASMIAKAKAGEDGLLRGAPLVAIAVVPKDYRWPEDGVIALTYLELAAHAAGIGACWGGFLTIAVRKFKELREFLGIGEAEHICGAQMLGYPKVIPARQFPPRREQNITWL